jgi:hypothetical protein
MSYQGFEKINWDWQLHQFQQQVKVASTRAILGNCHSKPFGI